MYFFHNFIRIKQNQRNYESKLHLSRSTASMPDGL